MSAAPTLAPDAGSRPGVLARTDEPDVLVVGAGPAGSVAAGLLARAGRSVVAIDRARFPRPKACGECVNPGAVAALERLGLLRAVLALDPAPLGGWTIRGGGREAVGRFAPGTWGLGVPRSALDRVLVAEAVARGASLLEGLRAEAIEPARAGSRPVVRARAAGGGYVTFRPRVVVGADGLRSRVASCLGLVRRRPRLRRVSATFRLRPPLPRAGTCGLLHAAGGVTLGLAPVDGEGSAWNATLVVDAPRHARRLAADPTAFLREVLRARSGPAAARGWSVEAGPWTSGPFDRPLRRAWAPGVVLVGDAAGYFDPFTGQGIQRALRSAELAAEAVGRALDGPLAEWDALEAYGRTWFREVAPGRRVQRLVDGVVSRPRLLGAALAAGRAPGSLDRLIRVTGDVAPARSLLAPSWWLGILAGAACGGRARGFRVANGAGGGSVRDAGERGGAGGPSC